MSRLNDFEPVKFKIHLTRANRIATGSSSSTGVRVYGLNSYQRKYEQPKMYRISCKKTRMKYSRRRNIGSILVAENSKKLPMFGRPSGQEFSRNFWRKLQFFKVSRSYGCFIFPGATMIRLTSRQINKNENQSTKRKKD